ncbi:hypothetical protein NESM_000855500 [Novymonas esmeraldas]|uniref:Stealth protein CR3 conserved region 3 domain-containing protein n=1 Tax=Novymonas esmeraldas TaxID=1808958 RepID=A0AAW0F0P1_9TRYP
MFLGGNGGLRKLSTKHDSGASVSLPGGWVGVGSARLGRRRDKRGVYVGFAVIVASLLVVAGVYYIATSGGPAPTPQRYVEGDILADAGVSGLTAQAAARARQRWSTSPPASVHTRATPQPPTPPPLQDQRHSTLTATVETPSLPTTTLSPATDAPTPLPSPATAAEAELNEREHETEPLDTDTSAAAPSTTTTTTETPDPRSVRPTLYRSDPVYQLDDGEYAPEEPERLPGLQLHRRTFTPAELLEHFGDTDFIYSFVNGSEVNHHYRKEIRGVCLDAILRAENELYTAANAALRSSTFDFASLRCAPLSLRDSIVDGKTLGDLLRAVTLSARGGSDNRDRETDELRHSLRSLEQHVRWHRGRVVMVSPGHHPTWLDGARNFLAGACGDAHVQALRSSGTHLRVTTVHQDAVMPYGLRLTADSHVIEQHLWRVRNTTAVHVYMNDDYFVNRDVAVTDLFNEYGGTIVRTEETVISGVTAGNASSPTWAEGVANTNHVAAVELDLQHEDEVPDGVVHLWQQQNEVLTSWKAEAVLRGGASLPTITKPDPRHDMMIMLERVDHSSTSPPPVELQTFATAEDVHAAYGNSTFGAVRPRFYATHAPFVYCTNMLRYLALRYQREFAVAAFLHRQRSSSDLYVPFLYNAFIMARPWQASPRFPAYLALRKQLAEQRRRDDGGADELATRTPGVAEPRSTAPTRIASIALDNVDGCAPATMLVGPVESGCFFGKFTDDLGLNDAFIRQVRQRRPLFFNVNAGLSTAEAADQLRTFLHDKFPTPVYLEATTGAAADGGAEHVDDGLEVNADAATGAAEHDAALHATFDALMALPVVGLVSYTESVCPLVRSLSLAFAGHHRGGVHVSVVRHGLGEVDATMAEVRREFRYHVESATSTVACAYGDGVVVRQSRRGESLEDLARRVLDAGAGGGGVVLPATCGAGAGGAGLRVRGFVVDARTAGAPIRNVHKVATALAVPAQTLALEDFRAVAVGPSAGDVVLVVSREDAAAKAVHWVTGASESDLLVTYPLPVEAYEDMSAPLRWAGWKPPATPDE